MKLKGSTCEESGICVCGLQGILLMSLFYNTRFIAFGTAPATERMPEMLSIFQEVFSNCAGGVDYPITEAEFRGRYYQAACNLQCFSAGITPFQR